MRNTIREFIEPSNTDKRQLWEKLSLYLTQMYF